MKANTLLRLVVVFLYIVACTQSEGPEEVKKYTIEQLISNTNMLGGRFSPDQSMIMVTSDKTGVFNLYSVSVNGGDMEQVTFSDTTNLFGLSYFPNDNRILFCNDRPGIGQYHIFLLEENGNVRDLTPDTSACSLFHGWLYDKQSFIFGSNKRDQHYWDIYEMDTTNFSPKIIYRNTKGLKFHAISRNERYLALAGPGPKPNTDGLFLYDRYTGSHKRISRSTNAVFIPMEFGHDNKSLYYLTDENSEYTYLVKYNIATGRTEKVKEAEWDIKYSFLSENGHYRITGIDEGSRIMLEVENTETSEISRFPGNISRENVSGSESLITFWTVSSISSPELFLYDLHHGITEKLAPSSNPEIDRDDLVEGKPIWFISYDGMEIPAILYKSLQATASTPGPGLILAHDGPEGQSRLLYDPLVQYLVNNGYSVLLVNNRGSKGYGKTFSALDDRNHGEADLQDCIEGRDFLLKQDFIDTSSIGIIGESYGGFMVMAALTQYPHVFTAGVNIYGITNWLQTLKRIREQIGTAYHKEYEEIGSPIRDSVHLYRISPYFHVGKIVDPFLVVQGANDPWVLQSETDKIVQEARKNGVDVEYLIFRDEGHGLTKKENQIVAYKKIVRFLNKQLRGIEDEPSMIN